LIGTPTEAKEAIEMLRRMFALVALVSLLAMAACGSDVVGVEQPVVEDDRQEVGSRNHGQHIAPASKEQISDPDGGGGGGGNSAGNTSADDNGRRERRHLAP
jgi:hypothetical protein